MDYWNGGMEILKVDNQVLHPNKARIPKRQPIYTFYASFCKNLIMYTTAMYLVKSVSTQ